MRTLEVKAHTVQKDLGGEVVDKASVVFRNFLRGTPQDISVDTLKYNTSKTEGRNGWSGEFRKRTDEVSVYWKAGAGRTPEIALLKQEGKKIDKVTERGNGADRVIKQIVMLSAEIGRIPDGINSKTVNNWLEDSKLRRETFNNSFYLKDPNFFNIFLHEARNLDPERYADKSVLEIGADLIEQENKAGSTGKRGEKVIYRKV